MSWVVINKENTYDVLHFGEVQLVLGQIHPETMTRENNFLILGI